MLGRSTLSNHLKINVLAQGGDMPLAHNQPYTQWEGHLIMLCECEFSNQKTSVTHCI